MNILFVCNEYPPLPQGGIGTFVASIAHELVKYGHKVFVIGFSDKELIFFDGGVKVLIKKIQCSAINRTKFVRKSLDQIITSEKIDVVEIPEYGGYVPYKITACLSVIRMHQSGSGISIYNGRIPRPYLYFSERGTLKNNNNWIAVSNFVLDYNKKIFRLSSATEKVIHNFTSIDINKIQSSAFSFKYVIFVGKLFKTKGVIDLSYAMAKAMREDKSLHFVLVGSIGTYQKKSVDIIVLDICREYVDRVHILGRRPHEEVTSLIKGAAVLALPSYLEAFSLVPLEAMALGIPVLFTALTSGPETIIDRYDGLLVNPYDIEEITSGLNELLYDFQLRYKIINNGFFKVKYIYNSQKCVEQTLEMYRSLK